VVVGGGRVERFQTFDDRRALFSRQRARIRERARPRQRAAHVRREQLAIERERVVEPPEQLRRSRREPAAPQRQPRPPATFSIGFTSSAAMRFRPRSGRPNRRMKPAESCASYPVMSNDARFCEYSEYGDVRPATCTPPLNSFSATVPVTGSVNTLTNASNASRSGENHWPL